MLAEAAQGNLKPLAHFMAVAPISGEMIGDVRSMIRGKARDTDGIARVADNILYAGGLGLFTDTIQAARWGRLEGSILGPTVDDAFSFAESMSRLDAEGIGRQVLRQPVVQATTALLTAGVVTTQLLSDYVDSLSTEAIEERFTDFTTAMERAKQEKMRQ